MNQLLADAEPIVYPDSDGKRMADNTLQWEWIATIRYGLEAMFRDNPDVFVAADLLWYAVEGKPKKRMAPDVLVAFGRPKGRRGSYKQWVEGGIAPHVVFEVMSPGNRPSDMARKLLFYERHGVEEYYIYDPDHGLLEGFARTNGNLAKIEVMEGHVSPRLGVRFGLEGTDLVLLDRDGVRFKGYVELLSSRDKIAAERDEIAAERDEERRRADAAAVHIESLHAKLRELGVAVPDAQTNQSTGGNLPNPD